MGFAMMESSSAYRAGSVRQVSHRLSSETPQPVPLVFVVDPDSAIHESLTPLMGCRGCRLKTFSSAEDFIARPRESVPSCLLLDVALPGLGGLELQKRVAGEHPDIPIIFLSARGDIPTIVAAMKAGAVEFLAKPCGMEVLLDAIGSALERSQEIRAAASQVKIFEDLYYSLSSREREVMGLVVSGLMNKQVGYQLGISEITVKAHRGQVMRKMKAGSLAELVSIAARIGLSGESARLSAGPSSRPRR